MFVASSRRQPYCHYLWVTCSSRSISINIPYGLFHVPSQALLHHQFTVLNLASTLEALCFRASRKKHVLSIMVQPGFLIKLVLGVNTHQAIQIHPNPSPSLMHMVEDS